MKALKMLMANTLDNLRVMQLIIAVSLRLFVRCVVGTFIIMFTHLCNLSSYLIFIRMFTYFPWIKQILYILTPARRQGTLSRYKNISKVPATRLLHFWKQISFIIHQHWLHRSRAFSAFGNVGIITYIFWLIFTSGNCVHYEKNPRG